MKSKFIIALLTGIVSSFPTVVSAQSVETLGIFSGSPAQMKARVDLDGHAISGVRTITYRMSDGYFTVNENNYHIVDNRYITADVDLTAGNYAYRMEVALDDGTVLKTPCYNAEMTQAFMWLGDYEPTSATVRMPGVDRTVDGDLMFVAGTTYYKGVSGKGGVVTYNLPAEMNFIDFISRLGVQTLYITETGADGSQVTKTVPTTLVYSITANGGNGMRFTHNNASRQYVDIATTSYPAYVPSLPLTTLRFDFSGNSSAYGNLLLARLMMGNMASTRQSQTVTFNTRSRRINTAQSIPLSATASSGGEVFYRILSGGDAATLAGNVLTFHDGCNTEVVVEATQYGDDTYACASSTLTFEVQTGGIVYYTSSLPANGEATPVGFLCIDTKGSQLEALTISVYDNLANMALLSETDLMEAYHAIADADGNAVLPVDFSEILDEDNTEEIFRFSYRFAGESATLNAPYHQGLHKFEFMTDLSYNMNAGYGSIVVDGPFSGNRLNVANHEYAKGFGIHARSNLSWVKTNFSLAPFDRFVAETGKQWGKQMNIAFKVDVNNATSPIASYESGVIAAGSSYTFDVDIPNNAASLTVYCLEGGDGNGQDHGAICGPRFYYAADERRPQTLEWTDAMEHGLLEPGTFTLDRAVASSGLPVFYRLVAGGEYATLEDNVLTLHTVPEFAEIRVEAFQPGNTTWEPTEAKTMTLRVVRGLVVQPDQKVSIPGGSRLNELIVYGNQQNVGQVSVSNGIAAVDKLVFHYSFIPGEPVLLSLPTDCDLDVISDFGAKGVDYALYAYDTRGRAQQGVEGEWRIMDTHRVDGGKGYMFVVDETLGVEPIDIIFSIDNANLIFDSTMRVLNLTLDLSQSRPNSQHVVYVKPTNVNGNTLRVDVDFVPAEPSQLPTDVFHAVEEMRVTYAHDGAGIRLVLPDSRPAKVVLLTEEGTFVKAVNYISPYLIPTAELPRGKYILLVQYGDASTTRIISLD